MEILGLAGSRTAGPLGAASSDPWLTQLHTRLTASALRCYPAQARRFRQEGTAWIAFCLDPRGAPRALALQSSSGSALLDAAALDCVLPNAAPLPPRAGCFSLPVRFTLPR